MLTFESLREEQPTAMIVAMASPTVPLSTAGRMVANPEAIDKKLTKTGITSGLVVNRPESAEPLPFALGFNVRQLIF